MRNFLRSRPAGTVDTGGAGSNRSLPSSLVSSLLDMAFLGSGSVKGRTAHLVGGRRMTCCEARRAVAAGIGKTCPRSSMAPAAPAPASWPGLPRFGMRFLRLRLAQDRRGVGERVVVVVRCEELL